MNPRTSQIEAPPRGGAIEAAIILAVVALQIGSLVFVGWVFLAITGVTVLLSVLSSVLHRPQAIHVSLQVLLLCLWHSVWPSSWPLYMVGPLVLYLGIASIVPSLRKTLGWLRWGRLDRSVWAMIVLTIVVSATALVAWFVLLRPDVSRWADLTKGWPVALLMLGGLGFSIVNAAVEEAVYRGVLTQGLDAALGPGLLSVVLQAIPFGLAHLISGVPNGPLGAAMAGAYGLMLGLVRRRAEGMLAPFLAHIMADAVIFTMLAVVAASSP